MHLSNDFRLGGNVATQYSLIRNLLSGSFLGVEAAQVDPTVHRTFALNRIKVRKYITRLILAPKCETTC